MQDPKEHIDLQVLKKYLNEASCQEDSFTLATIKRWFMNAELDHELEDKSSQVWDETPLEFDSAELDGNRILDKIYHKIKMEESRFLDSTRPKMRFVDYLSRVAALLFIPVLAAGGYLFYKSLPAGNGIPYSEIHAPLGTRTAFYLPDGSTGWINGGSTLKFPVNFTGKVREVELSGEAYFNVSHNTRRPFYVFTEFMDVEVFGTAFNVMAYKDDHKTEVTLESGLIQVFKKDHDKKTNIGKLGASQSCTCYHLIDSINIFSVQASEKISWKEGRLVFKYEPFSDVVNKLNRWYNVDIVIKNKELEKYVYYGTFEDETLDEVLKLLQYTAPIRYRDLGRERRTDGTFEKRKIEFYYKK